MNFLYLDNTLIRSKIVYSLKKLNKLKFKLYKKLKLLKNIFKFKAIYNNLNKKIILTNILKNFNQLNNEHVLLEALQNNVLHLFE